MRTPNADLEIQEEMPFVWGLRDVAMRRGEPVGVGIHCSLKPRHISVIQANAIIAPDIRKTGKDVGSVVFPSLGSKSLLRQPLKMELR